MYVKKLHPYIIFVLDSKNSFFQENPIISRTLTFYKKYDPSSFYKTRLINGILGYDRFVRGSLTPTVSP